MGFSPGTFSPRAGLNFDCVLGYKESSEGLTKLIPFVS